MYANINLEEDTHRRLNILKAAEKFKTQSDAILYLILTNSYNETEKKLD